MQSFFDAHLHIIDPRFPLIENQGFLPEPFTSEDYKMRTANFNVLGGAVVSGSFQGFDQTYLIDALRKLGPSYVGVTQIQMTTTDAEIVELDDAGVRAIRFNMKRGSAQLAEIERLAKRVYELVGWHAEFYIESKFLPDIAELLEKLPAISIDHLGLTRYGFDTLLSLVDKGARVKATGFGRGELDVPSALSTIASVNPDALLFGTDLPSTRADRPFLNSDVELLMDALDDTNLAEKALYQNACKWYRVSE